MLKLMKKPFLHLFFIGSFQSASTCGTIPRFPRRLPFSFFYVSLDTIHTINCFLASSGSGRVRCTCLPGGCKGLIVCRISCWLLARETPVQLVGVWIRAVSLKKTLAH